MAQSTSVSSHGPVRVGKLDTEGGSVDTLPPALHSDTFVRKDLMPKLEAIANLVGENRYRIAMTHLKDSEEMAEKSVMQAAQALVAISRLRHGHKEKETVKAAKKVVRDVIFWRIAGKIMGLDSKDAVKAYCAYLEAHIDGTEELTSQLIQAYTKIMSSRCLMAPTTVKLEPNTVKLEPKTVKLVPNSEPAVREDNLLSSFTDVYIKIMQKLGEQEFCLW